MNRAVAVAVALSACAALVRGAETSYGGEERFFEEPARCRKCIGTAGNILRLTVG